jgi:hypothetical protein
MYLRGVFIEWKAQIEEADVRQYADIYCLLVEQGTLYVHDSVGDADFICCGSIPF